MVTRASQVEILILGAGWTSTFLLPLLKRASITHAATTTTGRDGTYRFKFDPEDKEKDGSSDQYRALPAAKTILITFPLKGKGQSLLLRDLYIKTHEGGRDGREYQFIQLGSTGIFQISEQPLWVTRHSKYDSNNPRAIAEDELKGFGGCVLNLSGLWGGERQPKNWIDRVAGSKSQLKSKTSLHMIHGLDVARGIVAVHQNFDKARGQRFILTDLFVYDWWALILGFAGEVDEEKDSSEREENQIKWVGELIDEEGIKALPRSMEQLGRCYDSREFWTTFGLLPVRARI